jgi:trans-2-enoyl-CoA reductase
MVTIGISSGFGDSDRIGRASPTKPFTNGILYRRAARTAISGLPSRGRVDQLLRRAVQRPTLAPPFRGAIERAHRFNAGNPPCLN